MCTSILSSFSTSDGVVIGLWARGFRSLQHIHVHVCSSTKTSTNSNAMNELPCVCCLYGQP